MIGQRTNRFLLPLTIVLALMAALLLVTPTFAEEGAPPADPPAGETQQAAPAENPAPAEAQAPAEPQAPAPLVEVPADPPAEPEAPVEGEPETPAPAGFSAPAAVQETDEQQVTSQYTGLPGNVYFYTNANVAKGYSDIDDAISNFGTESGKGMIYVSNRVVYTDPYIVNGVGDLTGIVFLDYYPTEATKYNATSFNYFDPSDWAEIRNTVTIINMPTFTLLGFNITANNDTQVVMINNESGVNGTLNLSYLNILNEGSGAGLQIENHTGTVNISNVIARSVSGRGASIGFGGSHVAGAVNITNSGFNNNGTTGLAIYTSGLTTLNGVTASSNQRQGVYLEGRGAVVKNSVFSSNGLSDINGYGFYYKQNGAGNLTFENVQFNDNHEYGLYAYQVYGNVSLKNVRADGNGYRGAFVDTCVFSGGKCQEVSSGNVTINNGNFANNGLITGIGHGLYVLAKGSIALTSVWAGENGGGGILASGAYLNNEHSPTKSPIMITDGGFSFNTYEGLFARSLGAITLKDVSASNNQGGSYGAQLDNEETGSTAGVTILNSSGRQNNFDGNQGNSAGLKISSYGSIVMNWVTASNNRVHGASISNDQLATLANNVTLLYGHFNNNQGGEGLRINSRGNISVTLTDCGVSDNASYGVFLDNSLATSAKTVTLDGGYYFNNGDNAIDIRSKGAVTVKNVDVGDTHNGNHGLNIINNTSPTKAGVTVTATRSGWTNQFNRNEGYGMYIQSKGTITINRTNAGENGFYGAYLWQNYDDSTGNVVITSSDFSRNARVDNYYGLYIYSWGSVTLTSVSANNNGESGTTDTATGVVINNLNGAAKPVKVTNGWFNGNTENGLNISSMGAISLTNVYTESNLGIGAYLDNSGANTPLAVSIKGGEFNYNEGSRGLFISSNGAVTVSNAQAHDNPNGNGVEIYNNWGSAVGNVSVTCSSGTCAFSNNFAIGVAIYSKGGITLGRLDAQNNGTGATIENSSATLLNKNVSISNCYFSNSKSTWGLSVASKGSIILTNVDSGNNITFGATLNNNDSTTAAGVTLTGSGDWDWFGGNGTFGLEILSKGKVTIGKISASDNDQHGMRIVNTSASADQPVSITNADISRNVTEASAYPYGLLVESKGIITLTNVWVNENGDSDGDFRVNSGASLSNTSSNKTPGVTLTNVYFNDNYGIGGRQNSDNGNGLEVYSDGTITIKNIEASGNSGYGANLSNMDGDGINTGGISITRTGTFTNHFDRNGDTGLYARSNGAITLSNLNVDDNGNEAGDFGILLINSDDEDNTASMVKVSYTTISNSGEYVDPDYLGTGGLGIFAKGAVILNTVDASSNIGYGIRIDNTYLSNQNVSLTSVSTFVNSHKGLDVTTTGNVTGSGLTSVANGNQGTHNGATITTNGAAAGYGSVTLSGTSFFGNNTGNGLQVSIANFGNLSLGGVTAEKNRAIGVLASVNHATNAGTVTITRSNMNYNARAGLEITARNSVLLNGIYALNNGTAGDYDGVLVTQNNSGATNTIQNCVLHGNTGSGLDIERNGSSTVITNTTYFGNNINNAGGELDVYLH